MEIVLISPEHTLNNTNSSANEQKDSCNPAVQLDILYPSLNSLCSSLSILKIHCNNLLSLFGPVILLLALGNIRLALTETLILQLCHFSLPNILRKASVSERVSHDIFSLLCCLSNLQSWERIYSVLTCKRKGSIHASVWLAKRVLLWSVHFLFKIPMYIILHFTFSKLTNQENA